MTASLNKITTDAYSAPFAVNFKGTAVPETERITSVKQISVENKDRVKKLIQITDRWLDLLEQKGKCVNSQEENILADSSMNILMFRAALASKKSDLEQPYCLYINKKLQGVAVINLGTEKEREAKITCLATSPADILPGTKERKSSISYKTGTELLCGIIGDLRQEQVKLINVNCYNSEKHFYEAHHFSQWRVTVESETSEMMARI